MQDNADRLDAAWADFKRALWAERWEIIPNMILTWLAITAATLIAGL